MYKQREKIQRRIKRREKINQLKVKMKREKAWNVRTQRKRNEYRDKSTYIDRQTY